MNVNANPGIETTTDPAATQGRGQAGGDCLVAAPDLDKIPQELKARPQWVLWKSETRGGKPTKIPYCPQEPRRKAEADNPGTWGPFEKAVAISTTNGFSGVGYEFSADDPFCGIDLDKCRDTETSIIEPWARGIIDRLASFTEISPSGTGVHILVAGKLPPGSRRKGKVEMYDSGRYFTMTGHHLEGTPATIEQRQAELEALHVDIFGKTIGEPKEAPPKSTGGAQPGSCGLSDDDLIDRIRHSKGGARFDRFMNFTDLEDLLFRFNFPSQSEADLSFCFTLAWWTRKDAAQMDRIFRRSPLMREKWDEYRGGQTYGEFTIANAIAGTTEVWSGGKRTRKKKPAPITGGEVQAQGRGLRLSDWGAAERFVTLHGQDLHYCHPWNKWLVWDDRRWAIDNTGQVRRWAKDVPAVFLTEAAAAQDADLRKELVKFAMKCEGHERQKAFLASAQSEPGIAILPEHLDLDPWLFNVLNGTLNLRTGNLQPHQREKLITKLAAVEYDPDAKCPLWHDFLHQIFAGNGELINFLQKAAGYALTGDTREQCLFFLYGTGSNGKSTLLTTFHNLLGEYAKRTSTETFLAKKGGQIPNDIAALRGARFVGAVEAAEGRRLAETLVKEMTGGDLITARFLHAEFFEFKPEFKIFLAVNHRPVIKGTDHAIWRRIRMLPFTVEIAHENQDRELPDKLKAELPGILNWALAGCLQWRYGGLAAPQAVVDATEDYRSEMDTLGNFLEDHCILAPGAEVMAAKLFEVYQKWAEASGEKYPMTKTQFGTKLRERGLSTMQETRGVHKGRKKWAKIRLRSIEG